MSTEDPRADDPLAQVVSWVMGHVEVDANFEGVSNLIVGDPTVLERTELPESIEVSWQWLPGERTGVAVRAPGGEADGPFVWVLGTDDGPVASVQISPELRRAARGASPRLVGEIDAPSGRVVIGNRASVRLWGPAVDLEERPVAEFRVARETHALIRDGYIIVVRLVEPGACEVFIEDATEPGEIAGLTIRAPRAAWLPRQRPMLRRPKGEPPARR
jgi:hypothetical protein